MFSHSMHTYQSSGLTASGSGILESEANGLLMEQVQMYIRTLIFSVEPVQCSFSKLQSLKL